LFMVTRKLLLVDSATGTIHSASISLTSH
jgi:hypothetical protein